MLLKVINDTAERGVKLIQDCNSIMSNDEDQKQHLLQIDYESTYISWLEQEYFPGRFG